MQTEEVNQNKKISKFARPLLLRNAERVPLTASSDLEKELFQFMLKSNSTSTE